MKIALCIFQTHIDGRLAQAEVEQMPDVITSRDGRAEAERLARIAFKQLHPAFENTQRVICAEILIVDRADPEPAKGRQDN